jgi:hypothetical protein
MPEGNSLNSGIPNSTAISSTIGWMDGWMYGCMDVWMRHLNYFVINFTTVISQT